MTKLYIQGLTVFSLLALIAGCGSIHIGGTTHTHIYETVELDPSDPATSRVLQYVHFVQKMRENKEEPFEGFIWDDAFITKLEKEQKRTEKDEGKDDEFDKHF